jgi:arylsulfatase A-like enzyme
VTRRQQREPSGKAFLITGAAGGALTFVGLWALCLMMSSGFSVMGVQADTVTKMVFHQFLPSVIWIQIRILATYIIFGAILGLAGAVIVTGFFSHIQQPPSRWWALLAGVISSVMIESLFLAWAIRRTPQLFVDAFYFPGGWTRQAMVMITDHVPKWIAPYCLFAIGIIIFVGIVLTVWKAITIPRQWKGWSWSVELLLLVVVVIAGTTVSGSRASNKARSAPDIVILAADSFRLDHLSGYGYPRPTSPVIDSLMRRGTLFTKAITPLPRTFPAWVSYLTGTYPHTHGILHMFPTDADRAHLPPAVPKILGEKGWHSEVISDFAGDIFSRIDLGFKSVHAPEFTFITLIKMRSLEIHWALMPYINSHLGRKLFPVLSEFAQAGYPEYLGHEARSYLKRRAHRNEPFLLTVFFSTTHFPYSSPDPYYHLFTVPNYQGDYKYDKPNLLKSHEDLTEQDVAQIVALYDGAIKSVDAEIGKILKTLEDSGLSQSTWIIITADHGENLYEGENGMGHGEHLRGESVLRVPLIIVPPPGKGHGVNRVSVPVSGIDLAPTLLTIAQDTIPAGIEGWSLLPLTRGSKSAENDFRSRPVFAETGLWFADWTDDFFQYQRIQYPDISKLCRLDRFHDNQIVLKDDVRDLMELSKHRAVIRDSLKLIIIPERSGVVEEGYQITDDGHDKPMDPHDPNFVPLRNALYDELTVKDGYERKADFVIPDGWNWRLNRRVTMEQ